MKPAQIILAVFIFIIAINTLLGQENLSGFSTDNKSLNMMNQDNTLADPRLLLYDVSFYYINLEVSDTSTFLKGFTEIEATSLDSVPELVF